MARTCAGHRDDPRVAIGVRVSPSALQAPESMIEATLNEPLQVAEVARRACGPS
jgi:hypothetical protein